MFGAYKLNFNLQKITDFNLLLGRNFYVNSFGGSGEVLRVHMSLVLLT